MHFKRLYQTVNEVLCHWINPTCSVYLIYIHYVVPYRAPKNVLSNISALIRGYVYKVLGINSAILLHLYG